MQRLIRVAFWATAVFVVVMAALPVPPDVPISNDKTKHVLAFATLAALGTAAFPALSATRLAIALVLFGAGIEVMQMIPALHRSADLLDLVADSAAIAAVLLTLAAWRGLRRAK